MARGVNPLTLDTDAAFAEIRRQHAETYPKPPSSDPDDPPPLSAYREDGGGMTARVRAVLWWGRALTRAIEEGDDREVERLTHWWDEQVEGWARDVHQHLEAT